ncbi:acyl-CoA carboxylase subunit epsilon [Paeniglutamicibacter psychrophenolicus]|uniref:acyl-CoA carboxylase subunit epsilon n=1 Tax=Paeniglutamicibacter psychrophenolicus TaxID=257454 RepID=UPI0027857F1D|nr:acyl-CoA carboxylase subunit epsilon [Paeniglutamicibacter psychrophenolicus]MDQ0092693.1 hypothetical protein [Paeniglutamicibacter psychrophenolicus]
MTGGRNMHPAAQARAAALSITRGNPTAEEIAALAAVVSVLVSQEPSAALPSGTELRRGRIRRRRELTGAPLPWKVGRH